MQRNFFQASTKSVGPMWCKIGCVCVWISAVVCENLQFSAKICCFLRLPALSKCFHFQEKGRTCENLRFSGENLRFGLSQRGHLAAQNRRSRIARFPESWAWNRQRFCSKKRKDESNRNGVESRNIDSESSSESCSITA